MLTGTKYTSIRGLRSAASLKPLSARARATRSACDPRTQIRGLIEAEREDACDRSACAAIRGLRSAASLKPFQASSLLRP